jgi:hypothetical protein
LKEGAQKSFSFVLNCTFGEQHYQLEKEFLSFLRYCSDSE